METPGCDDYADFKLAQEISQLLLVQALRKMQLSSEISADVLVPLAGRLFRIACCECRYRAFNFVAAVFWRDDLRFRTKTHDSLNDLSIVISHHG
jgi:hypothetical protein